MRVLCLFFPHLPCQIEARERFLASGTPIVVGGLPHEKKPVFDASASAVSQGVRIGMSLRHAYSYCPRAVFLPVDMDRYRRRFDEILDRLGDYSDLVQEEELGACYVEVAGLGKLYGGEENLAAAVLDHVQSRYGIEARAAVASSKFVSRVAAAFVEGPGAVTVPAGQERQFLGPVPVQVLSCSEDMARQLELLAIRTLEDLAALGAGPVASQFGREGQLAYRLACGEDDSPIVPRKRPVLLEQQKVFQEPACSIDGIVRACGECLNVLCGRLRSRWQLCRRMELFLLVGDETQRVGAWDIKMPTSSSKAMLSLLRLKLDQLNVKEPVWGVKVVLSRLCVDGSQLSLNGRSRTGSARSTAVVVKEMNSRYGPGSVKRARIDQGALLPEQGFRFENL